MEEPWGGGQAGLYEKASRVAECEGQSGSVEPIWKLLTYLQAVWNQSGSS